MRLIYWLAVGVMVGGCSTEPQREADGGSKPESGGHAFNAATTVDSQAMRAPIVEPPEDGDNERPRGEEDRRHAETEQRHENDQNYHPPKNFRGFYSSGATPELKKIVYRHGERLRKIYGIRNFTMRTPTHAEVGDATGQQLFDELMEAKHELWRRWEAGDQSARLPEFAP